MNDRQKTAFACTLCLCLVMTRSLSADPVRVVTVDATDKGAAALGLSVCDVYVEFDDYFDNLLVVGGLDTFITTDDPAGFYQHAWGTNTAPQQGFIDLFPDLAYDSFVTIGLLVADGTDSTFVLPDFDSNLFNTGGVVVGSWATSNPTNGQGNPDVNLLVPMAQFTVDAGYNVFGEVWVFFNEGNSPRKFFFSCTCSSPPQADFNGDGWVTGGDLAHLLSNWGPCSGCDADLDGDGTVGASDLARLLGEWGPC